MTGALPRRPPNSTTSPGAVPGAGMIRTAVVLWFMTPIAASSAIIPAIVEEGVSPGTATMSRPTEQIAVIASSFASEIAPASAASIMPSSSDTGMNDPERPPTREHAMRPPFFTASLSRASAAVVPCAPTRSNPIASSARATESPISEVGARDRSTIPKSTPRRSAAMRPTSSPMRVILKADFLTVSASASKGSPAAEAIARVTTPGPETPTDTTQSGISTPWKAPAMNGLSPTELAKTTSLAAPSPFSVARAEAVIASPMARTASMLIPAREDPTLTDEQTTFVEDRASGMESMRARSLAVAPFSTRAENPPMKSTPTAAAASSSI